MNKVVRPGFHSVTKVYTDRVSQLAFEEQEAIGQVCKALEGLMQKPEEI